MSTRSAKYRRACKECQSRHLKCDLAKPCRACSKAGRPCTETSRYQFRHSGKRNVRSERVVGEITQVDVPPTAESHQEFQFTPGSPNPQPRFPEQPEIDDSDLSVTRPDYSSRHEDTLYPIRKGVRDISSSRGAWRSAETTRSSSISGTSCSSREKTGLWPLKDQDEAFLMRYFVTQLSLWFDYCDKERHFSTVVVQAAATSPTLNNAILAVSAKHLSVTRGFDRFVPDRYQRECFKTLIPALTSQEAVLDESLFAATVILRFFDEMTERLDEQDTASHIFGSHMLVNARQAARAHSSSRPSSLRSATLLIELRQEIHIAFMTNRPPPPLVEYCIIDRSLDPADDWTWAKRMIAQTADILTYCNGDGSKSLERWSELRDYLDVWRAAVPPSFKAIHVEEASIEAGLLFPIRWFANDCHTASHLYLAMSTILLLAHDPQIPSLGPLRTSKLEDVDSKIKEQVRLICGMALSDEIFFTNKTVASSVIAMCGERFTSRREQEAFIDILKRTEAHVAWPHLRSQERLKRSWGWDVD